MCWLAFGIKIFHTIWSERLKPAFPSSARPTASFIGSELGNIVGRGRNGPRSSAAILFWYYIVISTNIIIVKQTPMKQLLVCCTNDYDTSAGDREARYQHGSRTIKIGANSGRLLTHELVHASLCY